ncbi:hypothetical protein C8R44DRAFT_743072 [Mycena epipterygia]|nr:hypothetical protein C8R44DRAFT_743072 [Mycena epipterygia]
MLNRNTINIVISSLLASWAARAMAQTETTAVTLWQFGNGRLLSGQVTLPMEPIGTASNGASTTYLYQALNPAVIVTTNDAGFLTLTTPSATPRTIVASASGWVEYFGTTIAIACNLVNSEFGQCLDGTSTANTGVPTPEVLALTPAPAPDPTLGTPFVPHLTSSPTPTQNQFGKPAPVGAIVGGILGGFAALLIGLTLITIWRRRRIREIQHEVIPRQYSSQPGFAYAASNGFTSDPPQFASSSFTGASQLETATISSAFSPPQREGFREKRGHDLAAGTHGRPQSNQSDSSTIELARAFYQRMHHGGFEGEQAPPHMNKAFRPFSSGSMHRNDGTAIFIHSDASNGFERSLPCPSHAIGASSTNSRDLSPITSAD